jgi:hypothetical protein
MVALNLELLPLAALLSPVSLFAIDSADHDPGIHFAGRGAGGGECGKAGGQDGVKREVGRGAHDHLSFGDCS